MTITQTFPQDGGGWFKSSFCNQSQTCVEVRFVESIALLRHSRKTDGPVLAFTRAEWEAFELGVFNGEFSMP